MDSRGAVTSLSACLERSATLLATRLVQLEDRLQQGDEEAWIEYRATADTLASLRNHLTPGRRGELLSTRQMAERFGIAPKTLLKRKAKGLATPALQLGKRGRAAIRWRGDEAIR